MGRATQDPIKVWEHIYGGLNDDSHEETPKFASLFSGFRPLQRDLFPGKPNKSRLEDVQTVFFRWPEDAGQAREWVQEETKKEREVYHCAHLLTGHKRIKDNAAPVAALYADGDGGKVPQGVPSPTLTVESSPGRDQYYWKLTYPIPPGKAEELNKRIAYAMGADKSGWDATQLLRPPGTSNHKYQGTPTVRVTEITGESYDPKELDRMLSSLEEKSDRRKRVRFLTSEEEHQEPPVFLDDYGMKVWCGEKVKLDDDGEVDRSASLLLMGRVIYDAGATRRIIVEALEERDEGLGWNKYTHRKDAERQYERIVDELERNGRNAIGSTANTQKQRSGPFDKYGMDSPFSLGRRTKLGEAIRQGIEPPEELIEGILLKGKVHQVFAAPGCGKSFLALWLTSKLINQGKSVLYLDTENGRNIVAERLKALGADLGRLDDLLHYYSYPDLPMTTEGAEAFTSLLEEVSPDLVVFDSWVNFLSGASLDENVSGDIAKWAAMYARPARERGITVLLLDHVPKEGANSRGSGRKKEEMDVQWQLKNPKPFDRQTVGEIKLVREKDREGWLPKTVRFSVGGTEDGFLFEELGMNTGVAKVPDLTHNDRKILKVLRETIGDKGATATEWAKACEEEEGVPRPSFYRAKRNLMEGEHFFKAGKIFYPQTPQEEEAA